MTRHCEAIRNHSEQVTKEKKGEDCKEHWKVVVTVFLNIFRKNVKPDKFVHELDNALSCVLD